MINDGVYGYLLAWRWKDVTAFDAWEPIGLVFSRHDRDVLLNDWKARDCHAGACHEYVAMEVDPTDV